MNFPQSGSERYDLKRKAQEAVGSHGAPENTLSFEARQMKEKEHTGIELTGVELAYLQKAVFDRVKAVENKISVLGRSISESTAPNPTNAEVELVELRKELRFLQHNLGEKLFGQ
ncbi:MAG: hypothetical protein G01um101491_468 [Parcubacteria group bacterium Gr01-1014_91]|nr:MAG: hypothetical protein G01um101491_468 [Parcubacteria group bacterium Gr01-1014_91]